MSRNEIWNDKEVKRNFPILDDNNKVAGPIILKENGKCYVDDGESHIEVDGNTGMGKSSCVSITHTINCIYAGENFCTIDPKKEIYEKTAYLAKEQGYRVILLDFSNPRRSTDKWNILYGPYKDYKSGDPDLMDSACREVLDISEGIYPVVPSEDPFWPNSASDYFAGLVFGLFETGKKEEININSIFAMMNASEARCGGSTLIKEYVSLFPSTSIVNEKLASYISAPNETRGSIHSVAARGLSKFCCSKGLMHMLCEDTIDINNLDVDGQRLAIYCVIPDYTDVYDDLAALFVSQLTQHFIQLAHKKYSGRLPVRLNVILEELASVGKSMNLTNLVSASRSRNIRLMLILQNGKSQLEDLYGKSKAATINACIGTTFAFSTNCFDTLNDWSLRCGEKQVERNGTLYKESLITPSQLAAMPVGKALVLVKNQYKFITQLPFYTEVFDLPKDKIPQEPIREGATATEVFDLQKFVEKERQHRIDSMLNGNAMLSHSDVEFPHNPFIDSDRKRGKFDIDSLVSRIDAKIAELEKEEEEERRRMENKPCCVKVLSISSCKEKAIEVIANTLKIPVTRVQKMTQGDTFDIKVSSGKLAKELVDKLDSMGAVAVILTDD